jgi:hypothetical protein
VLVRRGWVKERKLILFEKETSIDLLWYCSLRTAVRVDICAATIFWVRNRKHFGKIQLLRNELQVLWMKRHQICTREHLGKFNCPEMIFEILWTKKLWSQWCHEFNSQPVVSTQSFGMEQGELRTFSWARIQWPISLARILKQ